MGATAGNGKTAKPARPKPAPLRMLTESADMVPTGQLRVHPGNARRGDVDAIAESIRVNGFFGSLVVQRSTSRVLAGNHTLQAARRLKLKKVPVTWVDVTDAEALKILAADNRVHDLGGFDSGDLARLLSEIQADAGDLLGTGYDEAYLVDLLAEVASPVTVPHYETATVSLGKLKPHPRNYKTHPEDQVLHIMESIQQHGFYRNVVVAEDYTILAGHGVVEACRRLGVTSVPVFHLPLRSDSSQALKLLAVDNELSKFGEVDDRQLSELLKEVMDGDETGLAGTGYDERMLAALVMISRPASEIKNFDAAAEWVGMPNYQAGEHPIKLIINFDNFEDRQRFLEQAEMNILKRMDHDHTWTSRWPLSEREDVANLKFGVDGEGNGETE